MKILLYNPDNGVTQNFMPHLWMFLLQSLTPPERQVLLIDGNTQPMTDAELVEFARTEGADALRGAGFPVVMGDLTLPKCRVKRWDANAGRVTPTPWPWAKPTKPGRTSSPMPQPGD